MQIRAQEALCKARRLRRPPLQSRAPSFCKLRATEMAVRTAGRAGTATSRAGCWGGGQFWPES
eukprot:5442816-Alexandrium_andersonii.AAC.1